MLLNITSYASTDLLDLLDQASLFFDKVKGGDSKSVKAYGVIFNSTGMGKQLTTLPH